MISKVLVKRIFACFVVASAVALYAPAPFVAAQTAKAPSAEATSVSRPSLDYEFFKARVQPIFLKSRSPDHARCYVCHEKGKKESQRLRLEPLLPGSNSWTEEQSRRNFETVSKLVVPGNPAKSRFPMHPLAPDAGGDPNGHGGGRQFESQNDPDFQTAVQWIRGQKASGPSGR